MPADDTSRRPPLREEFSDDDEGEDDTTTDEEEEEADESGFSLGSDSEVDEEIVEHLIWEVDHQDRLLALQRENELLKQQEVEDKRALIEADNRLQYIKQLCREKEAEHQQWIRIRESRIHLEPAAAASDLKTNEEGSPNLLGGSNMGAGSSVSGEGGAAGQAEPTRSGN